MQLRLRADGAIPKDVQQRQRVSATLTENPGHEEKPMAVQRIGLRTQQSDALVLPRRFQFGDAAEEQRALRETPV